MGVPGPVTSAASAGVNQLIRLGSATAVASAQDVITDLMTHAARAAGGAAEQLDESFVPGPVSSQHKAVTTAATPAVAPRR